MLIPHKGHTDTIQVYSVTVMTHVKALQAGHSSQGTSEPITPALSRQFHTTPVLTQMKLITFRPGLLYVSATFVMYLTVHVYQ